MPPADIANAQEADSVDPALILSILWRGRMLIGGLFLLFVAVASIYLHFAKYTYTATLVVSPVESNGMSGLASKLGSLGGLAAAAGVNLGDVSGDGGFRLYVEGLKSTDAASILAQDQELMRRLFPKEWNDKTQRFEAPKGPLTPLVRVGKSVLGMPNYAYLPPNAVRLHKLLKDKLEVDSNSRSPVVTIHFKHEDPAFAELFLRRLDKVVDTLLRQRALIRASRDIEHLTESMQMAAVSELREALAMALVQQSRIRIAATSELPFAAQIFSGPAASFRPTSPKPPLVIVGAAMLGLLSGSFLILWRERRKWQRQAAF